MKHLRHMFVAILVGFASLNVAAQVTSNVFERVLKVRVNPGTAHEGIATAFTVDVDGRQYLVTAKHVVAGIKDEDTIEIFKGDSWSTSVVKIFRCDDPIDIAVLVPKRQLTVNFALPFDKANFYFGQDAYFLGFPYGLQSPGTGVNGVYPLAIIKRGTISGTIPVDKGRKAFMVLLDGYNNPGFSGGPIVYRDLNASGVTMKLIGVVSGFRPEVVSAMREHDIKSPADAGGAAKAQPWRIQQRADGSYFEYLDNGTYVALNTGIVQGYLIDPAIDLIHQHPIGPEAKDLSAQDLSK
jgi:trypsin-like peptidase